MASRTRIIPFLYPVVTAVFMTVLVRSGLFTPLFLIPLGLMAQRASRNMVISSAAFMILINGVVSFLSSGTDVVAQKLMFADTLYISALTLIFLVLLVPGIFKGFLPSLRGIYRVLLSSFLGMLALLPVILISVNDSGISDLFREQAERIAAMLRETVSGDVVQQSLAEQSITADNLLAIMTSIALRGGLLLGHVVFFGLSVALIRQFSHERWTLSRFHVDPLWIWVLSGTLLVILAGYVCKLEFLEILGWNGALLALLLYFLQGLGILSHGIAHPRLSRSGRFLLRTLLLLALLSPGINAVALTGLTLLGIAENWVSLRKPHTTGPSSTPGM